MEAERQLLAVKCIFVNPQKFVSVWCHALRNTKKNCESRQCDVHASANPECTKQKNKTSKSKSKTRNRKATGFQGKRLARLLSQLACRHWQQAPSLSLCSVWVMGV